MLKQTLLAACLVWLPFNVYGQVPLLWDMQEDLNGGYDLARAITLSGRAAVVVGNGGEPKEGTDDSDLVIQALGRATGAVRWSDQTFLSSGSIEPLFVSSRQNRAFAVGTLHEPGDLRSAFLVRAYDVSDGSLLWENVWHPGDAVDSDHPTAIVAGPTQVVVMGYGQNRAEDGLSVLVRAYDPETGDVLWENRGHRDGFDLVAFTIAANRNRVFIAGRTAPAGDASGHDLFLRAYDAATGALAWETSRAVSRDT